MRYTEIGNLSAVLTSIFSRRLHYLSEWGILNYMPIYIAKRRFLVRNFKKTQAIIHYYKCGTVKILQRGQDSRSRTRSWRGLDHESLPYMEFQYPILVYNENYCSHIILHFWHSLLWRSIMYLRLIIPHATFNNASQEALRGHTTFFQRNSDKLSSFKQNNYFTD